VPPAAQPLDTSAMDTVFLDDPALEPLEPLELPISPVSPVSPIAAPPVTPPTITLSLVPPAYVEPEPARFEPPPQARVNLGASMPQVRDLPVLRAEPAPQTSAATAAPATLPAATAAMPLKREPAQHRSSLAAGLSFVGQIRLTGALTVGGQVEGPIRALDSSSNASHVTITQTGSVHGDVTARNITVMGSTQGLLDAAGGRVTLHDSAVVEGRIRYTTLQVNGADLNAQLERVRPEGSSFTPRS